MNSASGRTRLVLMGVIAVLIAGGGIGWWMWRTSPTWSLRQITSAVENHDVETFEQHVDVEGIIVRMLPKLSELGRSRGDDFFGSAEVSKMFAVVMQGPLVTAGREIVRGYIEKGTIDFSALPKDFPRGFMESNPWTPESSVRLVDVAKSGKSVRLRLEWALPAYDATVPLSLVMRRAGSIWRVSEIEDPADILTSWQAQRESYSRRSLHGTVCALASRLSGGWWNVDAVLRRLVRAGKIDVALRVAYTLVNVEDREGGGPTTGRALTALAPILGRAGAHDRLEVILKRWPGDPHVGQAFSAIVKELVAAGRESVVADAVMRDAPEARHSSGPILVEALVDVGKSERALDVAEKIGLTGDQDDCVIRALARAGRTDEAVKFAERRTDGSLKSALFAEIVRGAAERGDLETARKLRDRQTAGNERQYASEMIVLARAIREGPDAAVSEDKTLEPQDLDWIFASAASDHVEAGRDPEAIALLQRMPIPEGRAQSIASVATRLFRQDEPKRALAYFAILEIKRLDSELRYHLADSGLDALSPADVDRLAEDVESSPDRFAVIRAYRHGGADAALAQLPLIKVDTWRDVLLLHVIDLEASGGGFETAFERANALRTRTRGYRRLDREAALMSIASNAIARAVPEADQVRLAAMIMGALDQN